MKFTAAVFTALLALTPSSVYAQQRTSTSSSRSSSSTSRSSSTTRTATATVPTGGAAGSTVPDVYLNVPQLSVGRIELNVDNLQADINLNANVAKLVSLNAGVAVSIAKVNLTIVDVEANLDLVVRLGNLVDIVNRVFESLDLNPLLISTIGNVTNLLGTVVGAVDGLLGSITQGGTTLNFLIDNLGNIVQEVAGGATGAVSTIVGNYATNMTFTGVTSQLQNGLTSKRYSYSPLNALVDIVFNTAGQVVQATVVKATGGGSGSSSTASSSGPVTLPTSSAA